MTISESIDVKIGELYLIDWVLHVPAVGHHHDDGGEVDDDDHEDGGGLGGAAGPGVGEVEGGVAVPGDPQQAQARHVDRESLGNKKGR